MSVTSSSAERGTSSTRGLNIYGPVDADGFLFRLRETPTSSSDAIANRPFHISKSLETMQQTVLLAVEKLMVYVIKVIDQSMGDAGAAAGA